MHSPETISLIPTWNDRKLAQFERAAGLMGNLQLIRHGQGQSSFMLVHSSDDFYEGIVIGQLPQEQFHLTGPATKRERVQVAEKKKHPKRRSIDLSDEQIDLVLERWAEGDTALDLPFVDRVWCKDGKEHRKGRH
jgi:hypothetical protein